MFYTKKIKKNKNKKYLTSDFIKKLTIISFRINLKKTCNLAKL